MSKDTSNPAFPVQASEYEGHGTFYGMTLRDYFAAKAMQGICANQDTWGRQLTEIGAVAYEIADAMIAARTQ